MDKKQFPKAAKQLRLSLEKSSLPEDQFRLETALAELYLEWQKPAEANRHLESAFRLPDLDYLDSVLLYRLTGNCAWQQYDFERALTTVKRGLTLFDGRPADTLSYAACLRDLGDYYLQRGDFSTGMEMFRRAAAFTGLPPLERVSYLQRIALAFRFQGEPEAARQVIGEALNVSVKTLPAEARGACTPILLLTLAGCFYESGNYDAALACCRDAVPRQGQAPDYRLLSVISQKTGLCLLARGDNREAIARFSEASRLARAQGDQPLAFSAQYHLGESFLAQDQFDQANAAFQNAAKILGIRLRGVLSPAHPFECLLIENALLNVQIKRARQSGNREKWQMCLEQSLRVIALLESFKSDFKREESQVGLQHIFYEPYHCAAEACIYLKKDEQAFQISQRYKGQFLRNLELKRKEGKTAATDDPRPVATNAIRERLKPGQTLLDYLWGEDRFTLFIVRRDTFLTLHGPKTILEDSAIVRFFYRCSQNPRMPMKDHERRAAPAELTGSGVHLYRTLLKPAGAFLETNGEAIIIPDGVLWYIPFEALIVNEKEAPEALKPRDWFAWEHRVRYLQNAAQLAERASPGQPAFEHQLMAIAPAFSGQDSTFQPLRHNMEEAEQACRLLGGVCNTGKDATEKALKMDASRSRILLLATHGLLNNAEPGRSALVLSSAETENSYSLLTVAEIDSLRIGSDIVLLSACQTARGKLFRGEGLASLARSFLSAGAGSVVATRWNADDVHTPVLVTAFLKNLAAGMDRPAALAGARRTFLGNKNMPGHPFFWAGMMLAGEATPLEGLKTGDDTRAGAIGGIVIVFLLLALIAWLFRKKIAWLSRF